jgi:TonB family protein
MNTRRPRTWISRALLLLTTGHTLYAQSGPTQLHKKLVGEPLYLRGFWMDPNLEFDSAGRIMGVPHQWPFTLSGIAIASVSVQGKELVLRGNRVALVAGAGGTLERRTLSSTTSIFPSGKKFIANLEVKLTVHADADGSFDTALKAIFVDGLQELATVVPPYWSCYAEVYLAPTTVSADAEKTVEDCVTQHSLSGTKANGYRGQPGFVQAQIVDSFEPRYTQFAASVGVEGISHVRFTVSQHGIPVGFQVVRAVGGGMDEETLKAISEYKFQPATMNGVPVTSDLDFNMDYHLQH